MHIVQFCDEAGKRRVGIVAGDRIVVLNKVARTVDLARLAIKSGEKLAGMAKQLATSKTADYAAALKDKRVLTPLDHPDPAHCLVTGTGLTHLGSAAARDNMHKKLEGKAEELTDSLKMFKLGLEAGKPAKGKAGVQPEWFYKGDGRWLKGPGDVLERPAYALDGGEEPEVAGLYMIDDEGKPWRLGYALGNEFSDHVMERQNYLYLAHSKLRQSAIGPEMLAGNLPSHVEGMSRIRRKGEVIWEKPFVTGEANMSHTLANLEYHHFKYEPFRRPGDVHVHYFGTGTLSIADGIKTENGDEFEIDVPAFGKPLRNRLKLVEDRYKPSGLKAL